MSPYHHFTSTYKSTGSGPEEKRSKGNYGRDFRGAVAMGNLCSKSENKPDNFTSPGRPLGASSQNTPSSAPVPQKITTNTPGRTLGSREGAGSPDDARGAAAKAAEARAASGSKPGGKLSSQLSAQKKQTQNQLLNAGSEQERRARDADAAAQAQAYN